jgi:hypothetical protein
MEVRSMSRTLLLYVRQYSSSMGRGIALGLHAKLREQQVTLPLLNYCYPHRGLTHFQAWSHCEIGRDFCKGT